MLITPLIPSIVCRKILTSWGKYDTEGLRLELHQGWEWDFLWINITALTRGSAISTNSAIQYKETHRTPKLHITYFHIKQANQTAIGQSNKGNPEIMLSFYTNQTTANWNACHPILPLQSVINHKEVHLNSQCGIWPQKSEYWSAFSLSVFEFVFLLLSWCFYEDFFTTYSSTSSVCILVVLCFRL